MTRKDGEWKFADLQVTVDRVVRQSVVAQTAQPSRRLRGVAWHANTVLEVPRAHRRSVVGVPLGTRPRSDTRGTQAEQLAQLADEQALRELVSSFAYSLDAKDPAWTASLFTEDGNFVQLDGDERRVEGRAAVLEHCRSLAAVHSFSRHRATNFIVRILPGGTEAWLTAYLHVATTGHGGEVESHFGHYLGRFRKEGDRWLFADWCRSIDFVLRYAGRSGTRERRHGALGSRAVASPLTRVGAGEEPAL